MEKLKEIPRNPYTKLDDYLISMTLAKKMHHNYIENQFKDLNKANEQAFEETKSAWIPFDILVEYLHYIKKSFKDAGNKNLEFGLISGVRIYFSAHNNGDDEYADGKPRLNVTLVPTMEINGEDERAKDYHHLKHKDVYIDGGKIKYKDGNNNKSKNELKSANDDKTSFVPPPYPPPHSK